MMSFSRISRVGTASLRRHLLQNLCFIFLAVLAINFFSVVPSVFEDVKMFVKAAQVESTNSPSGDETQQVEELKSMLGMEEDEMKTRLRVLFSLMDRDDDGVLSDQELTGWLTKLKEAIAAKQMLLEMETIDKDGDKKVTFLEMKAAYSESDENSDDSSLEELKKRFNTVDKDNDGALTLAEVGVLMNPSKDPDLLKLEIDEILSAQDKDGDRKISLKEFLSAGDDSMSGEEQEQFEAEFKSYDVNEDGMIDENEIEKVVSEPHGEEVKESVAELLKLAPSESEGKITKEFFEEKYLQFAVSSLTDNGEVLRFPADYDLGIPLENVPKKEVHEEL